MPTTVQDTQGCGAEVAGLFVPAATDAEIDLVRHQRIPNPRNNIPNVSGTANAIQFTNET